ncbi:MAG: hypothetical protein ACFE89_11950 [Candidatus Hodarchaeota archaeon]
MSLLHIVLDSPATFEVTKTELDNGMVSEPYVAIAHCIRAGLCISHALRNWVRIHIGFDYLGPQTLTLDPTTIRFLGTDERSILYIILRGQRAKWDRKTKVPHGVTLSDVAIQDLLQSLLTEEPLFLIPGTQSTWKEQLAPGQAVVMYCPLFNNWDQGWSNAHSPKTFRRHARCDLSILEVVHTLDSTRIGMQKD